MAWWYEIFNSLCVFTLFFLNQNRQTSNLKPHEQSVRDAIGARIGQFRKTRNVTPNVSERARTQPKIPPLPLVSQPLCRKGLSPWLFRDSPPYWRSDSSRHVYYGSVSEYRNVFRKLNSYQTALLSRRRVR